MIRESAPHSGAATGDGLPALRDYRDARDSSTRGRRQFVCPQGFVISVTSVANLSRPAYAGDAALRCFKRRLTSTAKPAAAAIRTMPRSGR